MSNGSIKSARVAANARARDWYEHLIHRFEKGELTVEQIEKLPVWELAKMTTSDNNVGIVGHTPD
mgnify:CR=1 FL=1